MVSQQSVTFNNGVTCPKMAYGTFLIPNNEECSKLVYEAIKLGYRHIDTAWIYRNEEAVGKGIAKAIQDNICTRQELFVTTKLWMHDFDKVKKALTTSLGYLGLDYVDLYLVHWGFSADEELSQSHDLVTNPGKKVQMVPGKTSLQECWKQMEAIAEEGLAKSIGVSNYTVPLLWDMQTYAKIKPVCNQMESHPYNPQNEAREIGLKFGTQWESYATIGNAVIAKGLEFLLLDDPVIKEIGSKIGATPAQVCIAWALTRGIAIVKSCNLERIKENLDGQSVVLSEEDIERINSLDKNKVYRLFTGKVFEVPMFC